MTGPVPAAAPYAPVPPEPLPYHRLLRNHVYAWWRPLFGALVILTGWIIATLVAVAPAMTLNPDDDGEVSWSTLLATNLSLAALIPLSVLVARTLNQQSRGLLSSVHPGLRWRPLAIFAVVALAAEFTILVFAAFLPVEVAEEVSGPAQDAAALIAVTLTTSALQAAGEEYFFRGYLLQAFGALVRNPAFAILITAVLFTLAHGIWPWQSPALFADRLAFGLVAGWLVVRTGGLEAAIAIHAVNNIVTFVFAALTDSVSDSLEATDAPWSLVALDVSKFVLFGLVALWVARSRGMATTARVLPPPPPLPTAWPGGPPLAPGQAQPCAGPAPGPDWPAQGPPWPGQQISPQQYPPQQYPYPPQQYPGPAYPTQWPDQPPTAPPPEQPPRT